MRQKIVSFSGPFFINLDIISLNQIKKICCLKNFEKKFQVWVTLPHFEIYFYDRISDTNLKLKKHLQ